MHIDSLILDDFKSFGRRTEIPFYEDFTTVSGPNGSGKSNIIDGILFALGLARARGIRAEKLTDLIYNPGDHGDAETGAREASVEVILDNEDRTLTASEIAAAMDVDSVEDADEIHIKRRVKETDSNYYSYYYLNGRSVNLSDIQDLLETAGVTPEGYNVVMQGDVTGIINMTPAQRRTIIDEIAGVAAFDAKKEDAFSELDTVTERVEEAALRIDEKESRLEQLADERETALEYQGLKNEKAEYEGYRKAAELEGKRDDLADVEATIEDVEGNLEERRRTLDERQGKVTRLEEDLADVNAEIERTGEDEQLAIKGEIEEIKGEIARLEDATESARERADDAESKRRQAFVELDRKQETAEDLATRVRETKVEKASLKGEIENLEDELEEVEAEIEAVDSEYEQTRDALAEKRETRSDLKDEKAERQREQDRLLDTVRRRSTEEEELEAEIEAAEERVPELRAEREDVADELERARENEARIDEVVSDLQAERNELRDELDDTEETLRAAQNEYADLEAKTDSDGSSYSRAVSTILRSDEPGVHGTVAQLGSVTGEYATACETAAGGRLANVVVEDDGVGERCIEYLKSRNAGRATFLPITEMDNRSRPRLPDREGVIDFAYNLVEFDRRYEGIFSYVLGSTVVVEDMATARSLMGDFRLVTVDGDLVERSGAMTGGSSSGSRYSFTSSSGRLQEVADRISELEERRRSLDEDVGETERRLDSARDRRADAKETVTSLENDAERKEAAIEAAETEVTELEGDLADLREERAAVDERMNEIEADIAADDERIATIDEAIAELKSDLAESDIPDLTAKAEQLREEITERTERMDDLDGKLNEYQLEKQYADEAIEGLHDDVESAQNRKAKAEERIEELEGTIDEQQALLAEKREAIADLEAELADLKAERGALQGDLREARAARDEAKEAATTVENRLEDRREKRNRLEWEVDALAEEVGEYDSEEIPGHDEVTSRIAELEEEMSSLEPVNMLAIEEYDTVEADLDDLQEKKDTLENERGAITDRIDSYEQRKRETFLDSFEAIDSHFREIFERLSAGTGELHLENESDPFDGGLTMKAEPGDKPIQRLDAMSGGEKSLTALAFIFALQRHNPAPFYALDEIDAFLDAANAERVGELVDELASEAQFVVVTHRAAMLERSERAIGVTMGENNVSAVTGIDLAGSREREGEGEVPADD
ncbi:chromosome segregation protein SMC [Halobacteriales archaeon QS_8_65_32]|nr:MAG: chromosome segregation protein SMC [Halobacteriales archaeon QS_8_65_32]